MNVMLSEEQKMLKKTARDFLTEKCPLKEVKKLKESELGYSPEIWKEMAQLVWMGLIFPQKYGGAEMDFLNQAVLLEEIGRACLPGPYFSTVILGGLTILDYGTEEQKQKYLPRIIDGEAIFTLALTEPDVRYEPVGIKVRATVESDGYIIRGTKLFVPDASISDYILVVARTDDKTKANNAINIFIVDAKSRGINYTVLKTVAKDKLCEVVFDRVKVPRENILGELKHGWNDIQKIIERAAVAKCCEMVGGAQAVLDMTVAYTKQRVQFEHLIGSFQAVQHHCSNMLIDVDTSRLITYEAAWKISKGLPYAKEAAMSKTWVSEAYRRVVILGHQVHGGVSIIEDHNMPLYFRQAKAAELAFCDSRHHRNNLIDMLKKDTLRPVEVL